MAVPPFLQPSFNYLQTVGVTDVATTITRIETQAVALGWTNPGAGHIICPANIFGQYIDLQFNRISATVLEMVFTDSLGRSFTRRAQITSPMTERLYLNTFGFFFDPGNGEGLWGSILDTTPELQDCHDQTFVGHGARAADSTFDNLWSTVGAMQLSSANPRVYTPFVRAGLVPRGGLDNAGNCGYSQTGSRMWYPCAQVGPVSGTTQRYRGRPFQALWVSNFEAAQSEFVVPLDQATTGLFKVLSFISLATYGASDSLYKMAVRKA